MANPTNTNYWANSNQNLSAGLTPYAQQFTYGLNTKPNSATQRNGWQKAASINGAGPNANNSSSPWSFTQFALGLNPFVNTATGQAKSNGIASYFPIILLIVVILFGISFLRKL